LKNIVIERTSLSDISIWIVFVTKFIYDIYNWVMTIDTVKFHKQAHVLLLNSLVLSLFYLQSYFQIYIEYGFIFLLEKKSMFEFFFYCLNIVIFISSFHFRSNF